MSVDTLVSIIDMVLQAIALGLAIMMAIYGNKKNGRLSFATIKQPLLISKGLNRYRVCPFIFI